MFGFLTVYINMSRHAFDTKRGTHISRQLWRIGLMAVILAMGTALFFQGLYAAIYSLMFYSMSLFVFIFPLMDENIAMWEYLIRAVGLLAVWIAHHMPFDGQIRPLALMLVVAWLVVMYRLNTRVRYHLPVNLIMSLIFAGLFWLTLPSSAFLVQSTRVHVIIQGMLMYLVMSTGVCIFWNIIRDSRNRSLHIAKVANYDSLTNAKSYSLYQKDVTEIFATAKTSGSPLTMVALDVDHFKIVNDQYGHLAGNKVLIHVATTLRKTLRSYGEQYQVYRTVGEEFTIVMPNTDLHQALPIVTKCWNQVRHQSCPYDEQTIHVSISLGVAQLRETDTSIENVFKRADDSLYISKRNGRDAITVDGQTQQVNQRADTADTYAFFAQGVYDDETQNPTRVRNELTLYQYQRETATWTPSPLSDLSIDRLIQLAREAVVSLALQRIQLPISCKKFLNPEVIAKLTTFMRSPDGPETLTLVLARLPKKQALQRAAHAYHLGGIEIMLDVTHYDSEVATALNQVRPFDGLKYSLPDTDDEMVQAKALLTIKQWHKQAVEWAIPIIIGGVQDKAEVEWAQMQAKIHLLAGDYYQAPELPLMG